MTEEIFFADFVQSFLHYDQRIFNAKKSKFFSNKLKICLTLNVMFSQKYILIAEDDEDDQFLIRSAFKEVSDDTELIFVENGIELIEHFSKFDKGVITTLPSLLIVDLNMPRKNGKEAISELRNKSYFSSFPTIIFSTTGNEIEKNKCKELGIHNFFVKPSDYNILLTIVSKFREMAELA